MAGRAGRGDTIYARHGLAGVMKAPSDGPSPGSDRKAAYDYARGSSPGDEGRCWMAMRIISGSARTPSFALSRVQVGDRLVAHMKVLGDDAIGLAFGHERQGLKQPTPSPR